LGIKTKMLRRWKGAFATQAHGALPGQGRLAPEQEARHRWRAENTR
jgi:hypothetical protein